MKKESGGIIIASNDSSVSPNQPNNKQLHRRTARQRVHHCMLNPRDGRTSPLVTELLVIHT